MVAQHFSFSILKDARSFRWRRFKQRKREGERDAHPSPVRLFSSNAIPYASVTLPRRPLSPMSRFLFPSLCFFVCFILLSYLLLFPLFSPLPFPIRLSFAPHPYVDISLSIDPQEGTLPVALRTVLLYLSLLPFEPFFIRTNPPFPFPR